MKTDLKILQMNTIVKEFSEEHSRIEPNGRTNCSLMRGATACEAHVINQHLLELLEIQHNALESLHKLSLSLSKQFKEFVYNGLFKLTHYTVFQNKSYGRGGSCGGNGF